MVSLHGGGTQNSLFRLTTRDVTKGTPPSIAWSIHEDADKPLLAQFVSLESWELKELVEDLSHIQYARTGRLDRKCLCFGCTSWSKALAEGERLPLEQQQDITSSSPCFTPSVSLTAWNKALHFSSWSLKILAAAFFSDF